MVFPDDNQPLSPENGLVLNTHGAWMAETFAKGRGDQIPTEHLEYCGRVLGIDLDRVQYIADHLKGSIARDGKSAGAGDD